MKICCPKITRKFSRFIDNEKGKKKEIFEIHGLASFNYRHTDTIPVQACPFWISYIQRRKLKKKRKKKEEF